MRYVVRISFDVENKWTNTSGLSVTIYFGTRADVFAQKMDIDT